MQLGPEDTSENPLMIQFFVWGPTHPEKSWWDHFADECPRLAELGFTQAWLPPPNKAMNEHGHGYDAYDLWDLGEFDQKAGVATRWGTKDQLTRACSIARQHGIGPVITAVLNQKLGADRPERFMAVRCDPRNRLREIEKEREISGWTIFDFPGRQGKYSTMTWTQEHFTGTDWDDITKTSGVYRITGKGHKGWSRHVSKELGNYDYLFGIDIDHSHPLVREDLFSWGPWVLDQTHATGFRLDATKHIDRLFLLEFIKRCRKTPREKLFCVAECWNGDARQILPYIKAFQGQTAFFDVPLHHNFRNANKAGSSYDLRYIFDSSLVGVRPGDAVTFVDMHDTQPGQSMESWVDKHFKAQAYALILLRPDGYPCVYYGDLYPILDCSDQDTAVILRQLVLARKQFAYGPVVDYFEHKNCIGFVRCGTKQYPGCAVVISNDASGASPCSIPMYVGMAAVGSTYCSLLDRSKEITIDSNGHGVFYAPHNSVAVWVDIKHLF
ncbi:glycoside hydrolase family 13 protein [Scleroderma citrinum]